MFLSQLLHVVVIPAVVLSSHPHTCSVHNSSFYYISPILESLQCYNDYMTHIQCKWKQSGQTDTPGQLHLYYLDQETKSKSPCVPYQPSTASSEDHTFLHCQYNTTLFAIGMEDDAFFFKTPHSPQMSRTFTLSKHVRVQCPQGLSQRATEDGGVILSWRTSYLPHSPLYSTLNYQVSYRRASQEWTMVKVLRNDLEISSSSLDAGCWYEARVRARSGEGMWSTWSPLVKWRTPDADLPGPANLQCESDGEAGVTCTWEVMRELAQFVTYILSYHSMQDLQCCGNTRISSDASDPVLKFSCSFSLRSQQENLQVELNPVYNIKSFTSHKHILLPRPDNLRIAEKGTDWLLSWTYPTMAVVSVSFHVQYWSTEDKHEYSYPKGTRSLVVSGASLRPSTTYTARLRCVLAAGVYQGPPTEWTEAVTWTTPAAHWPAAILIYTSIGVGMAALLFSLYFTLPACSRRIRMWVVSIPSPLNSKVLKEVVKKPLSDWLVLEKEPERTPISNVQVLDGVPLAHLCPQLPKDERKPYRLITLDCSREYQHIVPHGWTSASGTETQDKTALHAGLMFPLNFEDPIFMLVTQSYMDGDALKPYSPATAADMCVTEYVDIPCSKAPPLNVDPGRLCQGSEEQEEFESSSLAYTRIPLPSNVY